MDPKVGSTLKGPLCSINVPNSGQDHLSHLAFLPEWNIMYRTPRHYLILGSLITCKLREAAFGLVLAHALDTHLVAFAGEGLTETPVGSPQLLLLFSSLSTLAALPPSSSSPQELPLSMAHERTPSDPGCVASSLFITTPPL